MLRRAAVAAPVEGSVASEVAPAEDSAALAAVPGVAAEDSVAPAAAERLEVSVVVPAREVARRNDVVRGAVATSRSSSRSR